MQKSRWEATMLTRHNRCYTMNAGRFSLIDVATRVRFMALCYELSSFFGAGFLTLVLLWLRGHGVRWDGSWQ